MAVNRIENGRRPLDPGILFEVPEEAPRVEIWRLSPDLVRRIGLERLQQKGYFSGKISYDVELLDRLEDIETHQAQDLHRLLLRIGESLRAAEEAELPYSLSNIEGSLLPKIEKEKEKTVMSPAFVTGYPYGWSNYSPSFQDRVKPYFRVYTLSSNGQGGK